MKKHNTWLWAGIISLPFVTSLIVWVFGRYTMTPWHVMHVIWQWITGDPNIDSSEYMVVVTIRLARILLALVVGMGLSVSGVAYQSLFGNPLTTPDILGVSSGAAFGAALGLLLELDLGMVQIIALFFGILAVVVTSLMAKVRGKTSVLMLILAGVVVSSLFNALLSSVKFIADPQSKLPSITFWLMGNLNGANFKTLLYYAPGILLGTLAIFLLRWKLNILSLSEDEARSLGINLPLFRGIIIVAGTLITASCVAVCGMIGWVGLLIPHICRMILGVNTSKLVPASMCLGATFMVIIDTIARSALTTEIPIGILSSLVGAPVFILLLRKSGGSA